MRKEMPLGYAPLKFLVVRGQAMLPVSAKHCEAHDHIRAISECCEYVFQHV